MTDTTPEDFEWWHGPRHQAYHEWCNTACLGEGLCPFLNDLQVERRRDELQRSGFKAFHAGDPRVYYDTELGIFAADDRWFVMSYTKRDRGAYFVTLGDLSSLGGYVVEGPYDDAMRASAAATSRAQLVANRRFLRAERLASMTLFVLIGLSIYGAMWLFVD